MVEGLLYTVHTFVFLLSGLRSWYCVILLWIITDLQTKCVRNKRCLFARVNEIQESQPTTNVGPFLLHPNKSPHFFFNCWTGDAVVSLTFFLFRSLPLGFCVRCPDDSRCLISSASSILLVRSVASLVWPLRSAFGALGCDWRGIMLGASIIGTSPSSLKQGEVLLTSTPCTAANASRQSPSLRTTFSRSISRSVLLCVCINRCIWRAEMDALFSVKCSRCGNSAADDKGDASLSAG